MTEPRNPILDPQPGDVVKPEAASRKSRTVTMRDGGDVCYVPHFSEKPSPQRWCWITTWKEWCWRNKATVVRRANDC